MILNTDTSLIWLSIARSGKCTDAEVLEEFRHLRHASVIQALKKMTDGGYLHRFADGSYGVTLDNTPARGIPLRDIFQATGATK